MAKRPLTAGDEGANEGGMNGGLSVGQSDKRASSGRRPGCLIADLARVKQRIHCGLESSLGDALEHAVTSGLS